MKGIGVEAQQLKDWFLEAVDRDTDAFNARPRRDAAPEEDRRGEGGPRARRSRRRTSRRPRPARGRSRRSVRALELALAVARDGNPNSVSDAGVAGACALAACEGASLNVRINVPGLTDRAVAEELLRRQGAALDRARELAWKVRETVDAVLAR